MTLSLAATDDRGLVLVGIVFSLIKHGRGDCDGALAEWRNFVSTRPTESPASRAQSLAPLVSAVPHAHQ